MVLTKEELKDIAEEINEKIKYLDVIDTNISLFNILEDRNDIRVTYIASIISNANQNMVNEKDGRVIINYGINAHDSILLANALYVIEKQIKTKYGFSIVDGKIIIVIGYLEFEKKGSVLVTVSNMFETDISIYTIDRR